MKFNLSAENINYVKMYYKDADGFSHCIKAVVRDINTREIKAGIKLSEKIFIKTPQDIELNIACDNGLYRAETTLINIQIDEPYEFFTIKLPENLEYKQNREFFRVKLNYDAKITYTKDREYNIASEIYDISANGVRLCPEHSVNVPKEVTLTLFLPKKNVVVDAKYIRTDNEDKIYKISFSYVNIKESDLDYISQICFQKQLEEKRKELLKRG